jgi:hypothetical protein
VQSRLFEPGSHQAARPAGVRSLQHPSEAKERCGAAARPFLPSAANEMSSDQHSGAPKIAVRSRCGSIQVRWRSASRRAAFIAGGLLLTIAAGCGGSSSTTSTTVELPTHPTVPADAGCNAAQPHHVAVNPVAFGTLIQVCSSSDGSSVRVNNISSTVIAVSPDSQGSSVTMHLDPFTATTFVAAATAAAVPGQCSFSRCSLPGGGAVIAEGSAPIILDFDVDYSATTAANAATALAAYLQGRLSSPGQQLARRVATCADEAGSIAQQNQYWQVALRSAITGSADCGSLLRSALDEPAAERVSTAEEVTGLAKSIGHGTWIDTLTYGGAEILAHR